MSQLGALRQNASQVMMKPGAKHLSGIQEAVLSNLDACTKLAAIVGSSYGPNGQRKLIINHLDKVFVTSDALTILNEMEVQHPAANLIAMAAKMQSNQVGDGSNWVIMFAGQLLKLAEGLLRKGLHPSEIIGGYKKAGQQAMSILENYVIEQVGDEADKEGLTKAVHTAVAAAQFGYEDVLSELIVDACLRVMPKKTSKFNVDNVRVIKISGGTIGDSFVSNGMVVPRGAEGEVTSVTNAKLALFSCPVDVATTEGKGKTVFTSAEELKEYSIGEENAVEEVIRSIAETGVNVIVSGSSFGEMSMHFIAKYNMMAVKILSKFQLRRLARTTKASVMVRLGAPTPEEIGECATVEVQEIGSDKVTVFDQGDNGAAGVATIVVRGATNNGMDDIERAINTGVNVVKQSLKDGRLLAGAGAVEAELAKEIEEMGMKSQGLDQYAIKTYAQALTIFPRMLAENAGLSGTKVVNTVAAVHAEGDQTAGVNVTQGAEEVTVDAAEAQIYDLYQTKWSALRLATDAALTVLSVDQIIMAKPAGGPKVPKPGPMDA